MYVFHQFPASFDCATYKFCVTLPQDRVVIRVWRNARARTVNVHCMGWPSGLTAGVTHFDGTPHFIKALQQMRPPACGDTPSYIHRCLTLQFCVQTHTLTRRCTNAPPACDDMLSYTETYSAVPMLLPSSREHTPANTNTVQDSALRALLSSTQRPKIMSFDQGTID